MNNKKLEKEDKTFYGLIGKTFNDKGKNKRKIREINNLEKSNKKREEGREIRKERFKEAKKRY